MKLYSCDVDNKTGSYFIRGYDIVSQDDRYTKFLNSDGYTVNFETEGLQYRGLFFSPREAVASMIFSYCDSIKACERTIEDSRRRIRELRDLDTKIL